MCRLCNACPGQPVLVPSLLKHSERVLGFWYESRNPGRICVARLPAYARSVVKCPPPSGAETETRCRTTAFIQPCDVNAPHPLQHYCPCIVLLLQISVLHVFFPHLPNSHLSVPLYLYPNGFYHLRSYFPKLNNKPLLTWKQNKNTACTLFFSAIAPPVDAQR